MPAISRDCASKHARLDYLIYRMEDLNPQHPPQPEVMAPFPANVVKAWQPRAPQHPAAAQVKELEIGVGRVQSNFAWMKRPRETAGTSAAELLMEHLCTYGRTYRQGGSAAADPAAAAGGRAPVRARIGMQAAETSR